MVANSSIRVNKRFCYTFIFSLRATLALFRGVSLSEGKNEIEKDSTEINKLVAAARDGEWLKVWAILGDPRRPRKGYLINVIPESRRWGILHQAIYWNMPDILKKVLSYKSCDSEMPTKPCTFDNGEKGVKTPVEIASMYHYSEMSRILSENSDSLSGQLLDTFQVTSGMGETHGFKLLSISLAAYKNAFHPTPVDPNISLFDVMKNIFNDVNTSDERWRAIKEKVCEATEGVCEVTHSNILVSSTRQEFYSAIIKTYTEEYESRLYTFLNTAMRRQRDLDYRPTARDMALGPYILMYEILLLFWDELRKENRKTYRRMLLSDNDLKKYVVGTKFMWMSFVSSSSVMQNAVAFPTCEASGDNVIIFTIDNSTPCIWQPRNIEKYACYIENERTYPAGARFEITNRTQKSDGLHVNLRLLLH